MRLLLCVIGVLLAGAIGVVFGGALGLTIGVILDKGSNPHNFVGIIRLFLTLGGAGLGGFTGIVGSLVWLIVRSLSSSAPVAKDEASALPSAQPRRQWRVPVVTVGVTAVILLISIWSAWQRLAYLQSRMGTNAQKEAIYMVQAQKLREQAKQAGAPTPAEAARAARLGEYYRRMREKYQRATLFFWLAVPPDPPPP
jgi:hypothetical protein